MLNNSCVWLILFISVSVAPAIGQGVCHIERLKVDSVRGTVLSQGGSELPLSGTEVELFNLAEDEVLLAKTMTDAKGAFILPNINPGSYRLVVWFTVEGVTFLKYGVLLKVKRASRNKKPENMLQVKLSDNCFTSEAKVIRIPN